MLIKSLKLQLRHNARINQDIKVWNQIQRKRLKKSNWWNHDPDGAVQYFWDFIEVDFGLDPKTLFNPYDIFSHQKNLQNIGGQEAIVSKIEI
jgi:hypothetical protein